MDIAIINHLARIKYSGENKPYITYTNCDVKSIVESANATTIDIVGGDGTINSVINAVDSTVKLNLCGGGTGNDLVRSVTNDYQLIDVAMMNGQKFLNVASIGIDAMIGNNVSKFKKKFIPRVLAFPLSIIYTLTKFKSSFLCIEMDGIKIEKEALLVAFANGKYYGGGNLVAPNALLDDELLDIVILDNVSVFKIIPLILKLRSGKHLSSKYVSTYKASKISVKSSDIMCANLDGEIIFDQEFNISIVSKISIKKM